MARTITKSGSKVQVTCSVCGRTMSRAGLIGHMRFKHGKDYKAPLFDVIKPDVAILKAKATLRRAGIEAHDTIKDQIACPGCREAILAELKDAGYVIKPPLRVKVDLQGHVTQIQDKAPLNDVAPQKLAKSYTIKVKKS